ncbi:hypothetical protein [uncultured Tateyamaria sp.]|uniref:hypothetical protein n=1 Tax=Tateyamaria sp. 1078 TaxID=3417464 RepID=UPI00262FC051|nr:hypothetical protein [uncultured Tateyamaria sp.]
MGDMTSIMERHSDAIERYGHHFVAHGLFDEPTLTIGVQSFALVLHQREGEEDEQRREWLGVMLSAALKELVNQHGGPSVQTDFKLEGIEADDGFWYSCSGCHSTNQGAETGDYPYSKTFGCYLGAGCSECGGIGAVWQRVADIHKMEP